MSHFGIDLEALAHIEKLAVQAAAAENVVKFQRVPEIGENKVAQINKNGTVEILDRESRRLHELGSLSTLGQWLTYASEAFVESAIVVWVSQNQIAIVLDDTSEVRPHNGAYCNIPYSAEFELVKKFAEGVVYHDQKGFVRLLKHTVGHCLYPSSAEGKNIIVPGVDEFDIRKELVDTFSVLKFETRNRTAGGVTNSTDFLGKEAAAELTSGPVGAQRIVPSVIDLFVRPYRDLSLDRRYKITCEILVDYDNCRLALAPSLTELQALQDIATQEVRDFVDAPTLPEGTKVFVGKP